MTERIPANWPDLRESERARLDASLAELKFAANLAEKVLDRQVPILTRAFASSPDHLARILAIGGREMARASCVLAEKALPRLLSHGDEPARQAPASAVGALSYLMLMRCLDVPLPDTASDVEARWLRIIAPRPDLLNDYDVRSASLASAAVGEPELVPLLDGGGPLKPRAQSAQIAGANVPGFARHLAEVIKGGGGHDAVEGPWWGFLETFPIAIAAEGVRWIDLAWAALAMMVQFEKRPPSEVGKWLPDLVAELD